jgi:hypothetical protein
VLRREAVIGENNPIIVLRTFSHHPDRIFDIWLLAVDTLDDEPILVQKTPFSDDDAPRNENDSPANGLIH